MTNKILLLLFCFLLSINSLAYAQDAKNLRLQNFVIKVYENYSEGLFKEVYEVMYPSIKDQITEEEYVDFQKQHFRQLDLQISAVEVGEIRENPRLVRSLRQLLAQSEGIEVHGVELSYHASFVRGIRSNQNISKIVHVVALHPGTSRECFYLLWDPSSMEDGRAEK